MKSEKQFNLESEAQLTRIAANFFQQRTQGEYSANDVAVVKEFFSYVIQSKPLKKYKVAFCFICVNPHYWEFIANAIEGAKKFFLPEHQVDYFVLSDVPQNPELIKQKLAENYLRTGEANASVINSSSASILMNENKLKELEKLIGDLVKIRKEINFFEIESVEWPLPTLFRYHTFLQQEEKLAEYDVAIGSRYVKYGEETRAIWRAWLSICINLWARLFMGSKIKDYTSGFAAVRREVFDKIDFTPTGFGEYFIEFSYKCIKNNLKVIEVGYSYGRRKGGLSKSDGSKIVLLKYGLQYALKIIKWRLTIIKKNEKLLQ